MKHLKAGFFVLGFMLLLSGSVYGAALNRTLGDSPFLIKNPGSTARAMGGAFVSVANDSSAAWTNPAGLLTLSGSEMMFETTYSTFNYAPSYSTEEYSFDSTDLSFLSYSYAGSKWAMFFTYKNTMNEERSYYNDEYYKIGSFGSRDYFTQPTGDEQSFDMSINSYSVGMAFDLLGWKETKKQRLWFGISLNYHILSDYNGFQQVYHGNSIDGTSLTASYESDVFISPESDSSYSLGWGVLWKVHENMTLGLAGATAPKFTTNTIVDSAVQINTFNTEESYEYESPMMLPWWISIGTKMRAGQQTTIAMEAKWVEWDNLKRGLRADQELRNTYNTASALIPGDQMEGYFELESAFEYHMGIEHTFLTSMPFSLRGGAYYIPAHGLKYISAQGIFSIDNMRLLKEFPGSEEEVHYTAGFGWRFNSHFSWDMAVDYTSDNRERYDISNSFLISW